MKKVIIFIALLYTINLSFAQISVGIQHDADGSSLDGYFDPVMYFPGNKISAVHIHDTYENGCYYDSSGNQIEGYIKFLGNKFYYKGNLEQKRKRYKPKDIKSFKIGIDSFLVAKDYGLLAQRRYSPTYFHFIAEVNGYIFAKHYYRSPIGNPTLFSSMNVNDVINTEILVRHKDTAVWFNFRNSKRKFRKQALKYFRHVPFLVEQISNKELGFKDLMSMIKMADYYERYQKSQPIFYNKYWSEVRRKSEAKYVVKVVDIVDSIWTLEYYHDSSLMYKGNYSRFYPNRKNGEFTCYYPNGNVRKVVFYENDVPRHVKTFYESGIVQEDYELKDKKYFNGIYTKTIGVDEKYNIINDSLGNNILEKGNRVSIDRYDKLSGLTYTFEYLNKEHLKVYRILDGDTVFHLNKNGAKLKFGVIRNSFLNYVAHQPNEEALKEDAQGVILVSFVIDKKGFVRDAKVLNSLHTELDTIVEGYIASNLQKGAEYRYRFKPYKINRKKRCCEFVIPIEFIIDRFYRRPSPYYNSWNWHMDNQMMMERNINQSIQKDILKSQRKMYGF